MSRSTRAASPLVRGFVLVVLATIGPVFEPLHAQPPAPSPGIQIQLASAGARDRARIAAAVQEALARYHEWMGPPPIASLTIVDRPWRSVSPNTPGRVVLDIPWWPAPATMDLESQVAYGLARQWWPSLGTGADTGPLLDGLAWYLQSRVVEQLFDFSFLSRAHGADGVRYFGGALPWTFRILPLGWTAGLGRLEFLNARRSTPAWPSTARRLPPTFAPTTLQGALAFGTLENYVGWPALQGALRVLAERASTGPMTRPDVERTIAAAVGQDLSWFFDAAFDDQTSFDYAVESFSTEQASTSCAGGPCFRTRASVARRGTGQFSGTSRPASPSFEAGDAMELRVVFADGQRVTARWDGRSTSRTFGFESVAPATAVQLDPDRVLLLDKSYLDDAAMIAEETHVPVRKWVAYWIVWLQGAMLDYGFLS